MPQNLSAQDQPSKSLKTEPTSLDSIKKEEEDNLLRDLFDNDTLQVHYTFYSRPQQVYAFDDSLLNYAQRQYDPARMTQPFLFHIGNINSPAAPSFYRPEKATPFSNGKNVYEPWRYTFDNFIFYNSRSPFVQLKYGLSFGAKDDNIFNAAAGLNFLKHINFSLQYNRSNQAGFLLNDRSRTTNLALGLRQMRWKNRWLMQLLYHYNQFYRQENGGTPMDSVLYHTGITGLSTNIPINIFNGGSKNTDWGILMNNELALRSDTTPANGYWRANRNLRLGWDISYQKSRSLFYDPLPNENSADTAYNRGYNFDRRGLRNFLADEQFTNGVYLAIGGAKEDTTGTAAYLRAGVDFTHYFIRYAPLDSTFSILRITGSGHWGIKDWANIDAEGWMSLKAQKPSFAVQGMLSGNIGKLLRLQAWLGLRNVYPGLRYQYLHLNGTRIFNNDLKNEFTTDLGGRLTIPSLNLSFAVFQTLGTNFTYFNESWRTVQIDRAVAITGAQASWNLALGPVHLDNFVQWQRANFSAVRIPGFASIHSIYYQNTAFHRHLLFNAGFDIKYFPGYRPYGYIPLMQSLYVPETGQLKAELDADLFISYKIRLLRGYIRLENLSNFFSKKVYYQVYQYPQDKLGIRVGFNWLFNN